MSIDWQAWKYLLGQWQGENTGDPGQGTGTFTFSFDLDESILVRNSHTVYPATPERDAFAHDDLLIIYTEYNGEKRGIYFDNEEHVIHYAVKVGDGGDTITLESEPVPSMPQFKFTYIKTGPDTVNGRFEMAPPGKPGEFFIYLEGPAKRITQK